MGNQYKLTNAIDLTFDDVIISDNEDQAEIPSDLQPTEAMQERFMKNCVNMGILASI